jgi:hypothetical protein
MQDGQTVRDIWDLLDTTGKREWLFARRGSDWLPNQEHAKVQYLGRDPQTRTPIVDIDLGEFTESFEALRRLQAP